MPKILELMSGTGSIGKAFREQGWEVVSLDISPTYNPTIVADLHTWDQSVYPSGHFDVVWASPVCTHYSCARTNAKTPRDLDSADRLVQRVLDLIRYFSPKIWAFENPGRPCLLATREIVRGIPYKELTYCKYGYDYRKLTYIWTNLDTWSPRPVCTVRSPCASVESGRHPKSAQRAPAKVNGVRRAGDSFSLAQLYSMPPELCKEFCEACVERVSTDISQPSSLIMLL